MIDEEAPAGVRTLGEVAGRGKAAAAADPGAFDAAAAAIRPDDVASIIYTSGTTGEPKGAMLSHGNFVSNSKALDAVTDFVHTDQILSFLPLSHVLERMTTFSFLYKGASIAYAESIDTVAENLVEVRPTIMISVPRLFDKIYARVMDNILTQSMPKRRIFFWALRVGKKVRRAQAPQGAHPEGPGGPAQAGREARLLEDRRADGRPGQVLRLRRRPPLARTWPSSSTPWASSSSRATG